MRSRLFAALAAFVAGAAVMVVELLVPRLAARHVGTSAEAWTVLFGVVLGGLTIGNALGGRLADARPSPRTSGLVLAAAGLAVLVIPTLDGVAESAFRALSLLPRTILSFSLSALPAMVLLGAAGPLLARETIVLSRGRGRALGVLAAAGSAGSILGTYATGFLLVPTVRVERALLATGIALVALGAMRLVRTSDASASVDEPGSGASPLAERISPSRALLLVGVAGFALLLLEIVAGRIASRLVGNGIYTWTAVIGAVLVGLVAGNALGGRLADRGDPRRALAAALLAASVLTASTIWTPQLLAALARAPGDSFPLRVALGAVLAWTLPCAALGAIPPIAFRASLRDDGADGRRLGLLYAASTLGAVAACVLTSPVLVPLLGAPSTIASAAILLGASPLLVGRRVEVPWLVGLGALVLLAILPLDAARTAGSSLRVREDADAILARESRYGNIRVQTLAGTDYDAPGRPLARSLILDGFVHGLVDVEDPTWLGYGYESVYAAVTDRLVARDRIARALFLGGGAYTFPTWLLATRPSATADVVEIDPAVTAAARDALGLRDRAGLAIHHEDARTFVRDLPARGATYDLVYGDAFADVSVPFHLTTREFAAAVAAHLSGDGAYVVNVVDSRASGTFLGAFVTTLRTVFSHVAVLSPDAGASARDTFVVVASNARLPLDDLVRVDGLAPAGAPPVPVKRFSEAELDAFAARAGRVVLTDSFAPVETLLAPAVRRRAGR